MPHQQKVSLLSIFIFFSEMDEIATFCQFSNYYQLELRNSVFLPFKSHIF